MTNKEALQILNCERVDEAKDAYELLLFDLKLKFLQQIPPLKLIDASIKKIERLNVAFNSLVNLEPHFVLTKINVNWSDSLDVALNGYQLSLTKIRLKIANTLNGLDLIEQLNLLKSLQIELFFKFDLYDSNFKSDPNQYPIKLSDEINVFNVQTELKELGIQDNKISEYIRAQIQNKKFDNFSTLTKAVINAKKQIEFNELRR